jgi:drug/metabolite transporter (DMT)-like permease
MSARVEAVKARSLAGGVAGMMLVGGSVSLSGTLVHAPLFAAQAIRYSAAFVLLLAMAKPARAVIVRPRGREWCYLAGIAATGLVLFNVAIVRGDAHAEPAVVAVAVACVPVLLGVIGPLLEGRAPSRRILLAAAVVTSGCVLVEGGGRTDAAGIAWAVLTLVCESAFTLLAIPVLPRHGAWGVSVHSVWIGAIMFAVLAAVTDGPAAVTTLTPAGWATVAYLAVLVTAAAFVMWYSAVKALGPGRAGLLTGIAPVSAALTGIAAGTRAPGPAVWAGILIVMAGLTTGVGWPTRPGKSPRQRKPARPGKPLSHTRLTIRDAHSDMSSVSAVQSDDLS